MNLSRKRRDPGRIGGRGRGFGLATYALVRPDCALWADSFYCDVLFVRCLTDASSVNSRCRQSIAFFLQKLKLLTDGRGGSIFFEGQWAEIIPTYTKEEAEKLLNAKIV